MITGYGGFYGEPENQGYYVGAADAVDFQYPVSFLRVGLWFFCHDDSVSIMVQSFYVVDLLHV
jgi:hypothetical protein